MTLKKCVLIHKLEDYANFTLSTCDVMMMSLHFPFGSKLHNCCLCIIAPVPHVCIYTNVYMLRLVVYSNTAALLPPFTSPTGHNIHITLSICMYRPCNWSNIYIQHQCAITIIIGRGEEAWMVHMTNMCRIPSPLKMAGRHMCVCVLCMYSEGAQNVYCVVCTGVCGPTGIYGPRFQKMHPFLCECCLVNKESRNAH